jgi:hypothetical protein
VARITATATTYNYIHETNPVRHMEQVVENASLPVAVARVKRDDIWTARISLKGPLLADFVRGLAGNQLLDPEEAEDRTMAGQYTIDLDNVNDGEIVAEYAWLFFNALDLFADEEFRIAYITRTLWLLTREMDDVHRSSRGLPPVEEQLREAVNTARRAAMREHLKARTRYRQALRRAIQTETGHKGEQSVHGLKTRGSAGRAFETLETVQWLLTYIVGALKSVETELNDILDDNSYGRNKPKMGPAGTRLGEEIRTARTTANDLRRDLDARFQRAFKERVLAESEILP